jgi:predicted ATPase
VVPIITNPNLYVITGGPGAGKTTLLRELARRGAACVNEAARQIIQEQVQTNGDAVPWGNSKRYVEIMLERSVADFVEQSGASRATFFDRGTPDVLCCARIAGISEEAICDVCARCRYNRLVFIAPPWKEIYTVDEERKQRFAEALETYRIMLRVYRDCGYEMVELPRVSAAQRAEFVLAALQGSVSEID